jgi:hypothetical protein
MYSRLLSEICTVEQTGRRLYIKYKECVQAIRIKNNIHIYDTNTDTHNPGINTVIHTPGAQQQATTYSNIQGK